MLKSMKCGIKYHNALKHNHVSEAKGLTQVKWQNFKSFLKACCPIQLNTYRGPLSWGLIWQQTTYTQCVFDLNYDTAIS